MILLAVGTQFPFDRLVEAVDAWAVRVGHADIKAQIGPSTFKPAMLKSFSLVSPDEFRTMQEECDLMIAHAGMGSILAALQFSKPIIIMPRDHHLKEHRNGHQLATAKRFDATPGVYVAYDLNALNAYLENIDSLKAPGAISDSAPAEFVDRLRAYINNPTH